MITDQTLYRISVLTDLDPVEQSLDELFKTLAEEFGEVARIINGKPHDEPLSGELADVMVAAIAMYYRFSGGTARIDEEINKKLTKWERKQNEMQSVR